MDTGKTDERLPVRTADERRRRPAAEQMRNGEKERSMDQIIIEGLRIYAHHGVYREENEKGQNFYLNAVLETDTRTARSSQTGG